MMWLDCLLPSPAGLVRLVTCAGLLATSSPPLAAQLAAFEEGNQLYQDGDYQAALERYAEIVEAGYESGEVYYNIGNTFFKLGELGRSIVNYERALRFMPGDDDVEANLELARSLSVDEVVPLRGFWPVQAFDWWVHALSLGWLIAIVASAYVLGAAALVVLVLGRGAVTRRWAPRAAVASAAVVVIFGFNLLVVEMQLGRDTEGVVLVDEVSVQSAPSDDAALQVFSIHEGTKVRIDEQSGEWAEIVLADGKVGWVRVGVLEII